MRVKNGTCGTGGSSFTNPIFHTPQTHTHTRPTVKMKKTVERERCV